MKKNLFNFFINLTTLFSLTISPAMAYRSNLLQPLDEINNNIIDVGRLGPGSQFGGEEATYIPPIWTEYTALAKIVENLYDIKKRININEEECLTDSLGNENCPKEAEECTIPVDTVPSIVKSTESFEEEVDKVCNGALLDGICYQDLNGDGAPDLGESEWTFKYFKGHDKDGAGGSNYEGSMSISAVTPGQITKSAAKSQDTTGTAIIFWGENGPNGGAQHSEDNYLEFSESERMWKIIGNGRGDEEVFQHPGLYRPQYVEFKSEINDCLSIYEIDTHIDPYGEDSVSPDTDTEETEPTETLLGYICINHSSKKISLKNPSGQEVSQIRDIPARYNKTRLYIEDNGLRLDKKQDDDNRKMFSPVKAIFECSAPNLQAGDKCYKRVKLPYSCPAGYTEKPNGKCKITKTRYFYGCPDSYKENDGFQAQGLSQTPPSSNSCSKKLEPVCPLDPTKKCTRKIEPGSESEVNIIDGYKYTKGEAEEKVNEIKISKSCTHPEEEYNPVLDKCVQQPRYACKKDGFVYSESMNGCIKDAPCSGKLINGECSTPPKVHCTEGYVLNLALNKCEIPPKCKTGEYNFVSHKCEDSPSDENCPPGFKYVKTLEKCTKDLTWEPNCQRGFKWDEKKEECIKPLEYEDGCALLNRQFLLDNTEEENTLKAKRIKLYNFDNNYKNEIGTDENNKTSETDSLSILYQKAIKIDDGGYIEIPKDVLNQSDDIFSMSFMVNLSDNNLSSEKTILDGENDYKITISDQEGFSVNYPFANLKAKIKQDNFDALKDGKWHAIHIKNLHDRSCIYIDGYTSKSGCAPLINQTAPKKVLPVYSNTLNSIEYTGNLKYDPITKSMDFSGAGDIISSDFNDTSLQDYMFAMDITGLEDNKSSTLTAYLLTRMTEQTMFGSGFNLNPKEKRIQFFTLRSNTTRKLSLLPKVRFSPQRTNYSFEMNQGTGTLTMSNPSESGSAFWTIGSSSPTINPNGFKISGYGDNKGKPILVKNMILVKNSISQSEKNSIVQSGVTKFGKKYNIKPVCPKDFIFSDKEDVCIFKEDLNNTLPDFKMNGPLKYELPSKIDRLTIYKTPLSDKEIEDETNINTPYVFNYSTNKCEKKIIEAPLCSEGYIYDQVKKMCIKDFISSSSCPDGFDFNNAHNRCEKKIFSMPACPPKFSYNKEENICEKPMDTKPSCEKEGFAYDYKDKRCEKDIETKSVCPAGYTFKKQYISTTPKDHIETADFKTETYYDYKDYGQETRTYSINPTISSKCPKNDNDYNGNGPWWDGKHVFHVSQSNYDYKLRVWTKCTVYQDCPIGYIRGDGDCYTNAYRCPSSYPNESGKYPGKCYSNGNYKAKTNPADSCPSGYLDSGGTDANGNYKGCNIYVVKELYHPEWWSDHTHGYPKVYEVLDATTVYNCSVGILNDANKKCEGSYVANTCPAGYENYGQGCRKQMTRKSCEEPYKEVNGQCQVTITEKTCPPNAKMISDSQCEVPGRCEKTLTKVPDCDPGYTFSTERLRCEKDLVTEPSCQKDGFKFVSSTGRCEKDLVTEPGCQDGLKWSQKRQRCEIIMHTKDGCVNGTTYNSKTDRCEKTMPVKEGCEIGFIWNKDTKKCEKDLIEKNICSDGYTYNKDEGRCEKPLISTRSCSGKYLYNPETNKCEKPVVIKKGCDNGYTYNTQTNRCEKELDTESTCPSGFTYNPATDKCEKDIIKHTGCPSGYSYVEAENYCEKNLTTKTPCKNGYTYSKNKDRCEKALVKHKACPSGLSYDKSKNICKKSLDTKPSCKPGFTYNSENDRCEKALETFNGGCDEGFQYNESKGRCEKELNTVAPCPEGYYYHLEGNNGVCTKTITADLTCDSGYTKKDGECIKKAPTLNACPSNMQYNPNSNRCESPLETKDVCPEDYAYSEQNNRCEKSLEVKKAKKIIRFAYCEDKFTRIERNGSPVCTKSPDFGSDAWPSCPDPLVLTDDRNKCAEWLASTEYTYNYSDKCPDTLNGYNYVASDTNWSTYKKQCRYGNIKRDPVCPEGYIMADENIRNGNCYISKSTRGGSAYRYHYSNFNPKTGKYEYKPKVYKDFLPHDCSQLLALHPEKDDGIYDIQLKPGVMFRIRCDMTKYGGGWTEVAKLYEKGYGGFYGFDVHDINTPNDTVVLKTLPSNNTQTAFGYGITPSLGYFDFNYTTGNIPRTTIVNLEDNSSYIIHRSSSAYYDYHDPQKETYRTRDNGGAYDWMGTLTVNKTICKYKHRVWGSNYWLCNENGVSKKYYSNPPHAYSWAFSPNHSDKQSKGYAYLGYRADQEDDKPWTVWTRDPDANTTVTEYNRTSDKGRFEISPKYYNEEDFNISDVCPDDSWTFVSPSESKTEEGLCYKAPSAQNSTVDFEKNVSIIQPCPGYTYDSDSKKCYEDKPNLSEDLQNNLYYKAPYCQYGYRFSSSTKKCYRDWPGNEKIIDGEIYNIKTPSSCPQDYQLSWDKKSCLKIIETPQSCPAQFLFNSQYRICYQNIPGTEIDLSGTKKYAYKNFSCPEDSVYSQDLNRCYKQESGADGYDTDEGISYFNNKCAEHPGYTFNKDNNYCYKAENGLKYNFELKYAFLENICKSDEKYAEVSNICYKPDNVASGYDFQNNVSYLSGICFDAGYKFSKEGEYCYKKESAPKYNFTKKYAYWENICSADEKYDPDNNICYKILAGSSLNQQHTKYQNDDYCPDGYLFSKEYNLCYKGDGLGAENLGEERLVLSPCENGWIYNQTHNRCYQLTENANIRFKTSDLAISESKSAVCPAGYKLNLSPNKCYKAETGATPDFQTNVLYKQGSCDKETVNKKLLKIYKSCSAIKNDNPDSKSGMYLIDPDGSSQNISPFRVWCDMETDGGGWTLIASNKNGGSNAISLDPKSVEIASGRYEYENQTYLDQKRRYFLQEEIGSANFLSEPNTDYVSPAFNSVRSKEMLFKYSGSNDKWLTYSLSAENLNQYYRSIEPFDFLVKKLTPLKKHGISESANKCNNLDLVMNSADNDGGQDNYKEKRQGKWSGASAGPAWDAANNGGCHHDDELAHWDHGRIGGQNSPSGTILWMVRDNSDTGHYTLFQEPVDSKWAFDKNSGICYEKDNKSTIDIPRKKYQRSFKCDPGYKFYEPKHFCYIDKDAYEEDLNNLLYFVTDYCPADSQSGKYYYNQALNKCYSKAPKPGLKQDFTNLVHYKDKSCPNGYAFNSNKGVCYNHIGGTQEDFVKNVSYFTNICPSGFTHGYENKENKVPSDFKKDICYKDVSDKKIDLDLLHSYTKVLCGGNGNYIHDIKTSSCYKPEPKPSMLYGDVHMDIQNGISWIEASCPSSSLSQGYTTNDFKNLCYKVIPDVDLDFAQMVYHFDEICPKNYSFHEPRNFCYIKYSDDAFGGETKDIPGNTGLTWGIYDNNPSGGSIETKYDQDIDADTIMLINKDHNSSDFISNGYSIGKEYAGDQNQSLDPTGEFNKITWTSKYLSSKARVYVVVETDKGIRYITYNDGVTTPRKEGEYLLYSYPKELMHEWSTFIRDLNIDLKTLEKDNKIKKVIGFLSRGNGSIHGIQLMKSDTREDFAKKIYTSGIKCSISNLKLDKENGFCYQTIDNDDVEYDLYSSVKNAYLDPFCPEEYLMTPNKDKCVFKDMNAKYDFEKNIYYQNRECPNINDKNDSTAMCYKKVEGAIMDLDKLVASTNKKCMEKYNDYYAPKNLCYINLHYSNEVREDFTDYLYLSQFVCSNDSFSYNRGENICYQYFYQDEANLINKFIGSSNPSLDKDNKNMLFLFPTKKINSVPSCGDGEFLDNKCKYTPECEDENATFTPLTNSCIAEGEKNCEPPFVLSNGQCVSSVICPEGTELKDGKCLAEKTPVCEIDQTLNSDGECVSDPFCRQGFRENNSTCDLKYTYYTYKCSNGADIADTGNNCFGACGYDGCYCNNNEPPANNCKEKIVDSGETYIQKIYERALEKHPVTGNPWFSGEIKGSTCGKNCKFDVFEIEGKGNKLCFTKGNKESDCITVKNCLFRGKIKQSSPIKYLSVSQYRIFSSTAGSIYSTCRMNGSLGIGVKAEGFGEIKSENSRISFIDSFKDGEIGFIDFIPSAKIGDNRDDFYPENRDIYYLAKEGFTILKNGNYIYAGKTGISPEDCQSVAQKFGYAKSQDFKRNLPFGKILTKGYDTACLIEKDTLASYNSHDFNDIEKANKIIRFLPGEEKYFCSTWKCDNGKCAEAVCPNGYNASDLEIKKIAEIKEIAIPDKNTTCVDANCDANANFFPYCAKKGGCDLKSPKNIQTTDDNGDVKCYELYCKKPEDVLDPKNRKCKSMDCPVNTEKTPDGRCREI